MLSASQIILLTIFITLVILLIVYKICDTIIRIKESSTLMGSIKQVQELFDAGKLTINESERKDN